MMEYYLVLLRIIPIDGLIPLQLCQIFSIQRLALLYFEVNGVGESTPIGPGFQYARAVVFEA